MNVARTGKIARLPHAIRDQLNERLREGQKARLIVAWLNSLPEVRAVLAVQFAAKPIRPQNLSEWRHGGYRDWLHQQQALEFSRSPIEGPRELETSTTSSPPGSPAVAPLVKRGKGSSPDYPPQSDLLAAWLAARYALVSRSLKPGDNPEHWRRLRELCADIAKLRRGDHTAERMRLDRQRLAVQVAVLGGNPPQAA